MEIIEHVSVLHREGTLLGDAAARTDPSAPVPTCPDWRLGDLVRHVGHVHRWAAAYPSRGLRTPLDEAGERAAIGPAPSDADLVDWFREGHAALVDALTRAPADLDCWAFLPAPSPLAFWARRQAHETAVHRFDADAAAGVEGPRVDAAFALDGIDELLRGFMARSGSKLRSDQPRTIRVRATDGPGSWHLTITREPLGVTLGDAPEPADLTLSGPARDLYLLLWNRLPVGPARTGAVTGAVTGAGAGSWAETGPVAKVELSGDETLLGLWRDAAAIGWS
ncbi:maleylpyruvate isomerase family mycothiol-dependent enzyme [Kitasatospora sp. NPDC101176]|uniref:maleylpyruvate isomerase family mycothiol-dependent enzyme n=1 Tax=Kitasatospora sp. NPDC101176 TaxID=3364099 RepID=UPI003802B33C